MWTTLQLTYLLIPNAHLSLSLQHLISSLTTKGQLTYPSTSVLTAVFQVNVG